MFVMLDMILTLLFQGILERPDTLELDLATVSDMANCSQFGPVGNWSTLRGDKRNHLVFCLARPQWFWRHDEQPTLYQTACDTFMADEQLRAWPQLGSDTRRALGECAHYRLLAESLRRRPDMRWLPQDLLTHPARPAVMLAGLQRTLATVWQYETDLQTDPYILTSESYAQLWRSMGLNVSHYERIEASDESWTEFKHANSLQDYLKWNNAHTQLGLVQWLRQELRVLANGKPRVLSELRK